MLQLFTCLLSKRATPKGIKEDVLSGQSSQCLVLSTVNSGCVEGEVIQQRQCMVETWQNMIEYYRILAVKRI